MPSPQEIHSALNNVTDESSFIQDLLVDTLGWPVPEVESLAEVSFEWDEEELKAAGLSRKLLDGKVKQLQPLADQQPWGIFLLEFKHDTVFTQSRGMTGPLRKVLRGLVPKRTRDASKPAWKREHLLFICTHNFQHFRFAYFKAPRDGAKTAPLAAFGWSPEEPARTVCEVNLPQLQWPARPQDADTWVALWAAAFDVDRVTKRFYQDYVEVFGATEAAIGAAAPLPEDDLRMFTQSLFNRLMFLRFIERKGWLTFNGRKDYLRALFEAGRIKGRSFFQSRLEPLFFEALAVEGKQQHPGVGEVPFLNGGLFEQSKLDKKVKDLPDTAFAPIIGEDGLFYRYNFTIEESTPLDVEVAVDPEMLGKIFEELVTGRHESGSYYTPRAIVSFMCREALKEHLASFTSAAPEHIEALVDMHQAEGLPLEHAREISRALDTLKAVDHACGSGAYLLGLLQEIIALYRALFAEKLQADSRSLYKLKLDIISNNLYGVDIDPFATNIAMLRLWLSLSVEARDPVPLPNLDFKIECADAVCNPMPNPERFTRLGFKFQEDLFAHGQVETWLDALIKQKDLYLRSHGPRKESLRQGIHNLERQIKGVLNVQHEGKELFYWIVQFAEVFGLRGGFDIVLANPPYVRQELIREIKPALRRFYGPQYCGTADLYTYFYLRAVQLLRSGGTLVFISSNKWFRANYGKNLREYIALHTAVRSITDFGDLPVFESATAYPMIFIASKKRTDELKSAFSSGTEATPILAEIPSLDPPYPDIKALIAAHGHPLPQTAIQGATWTLTTHSTAARLDQMRKNSIPLGEYVNGQIYYGIKTGFNGAFVIDGETRQRLIDQDPNSAEIIVTVHGGMGISDGTCFPERCA